MSLDHVFFLRHSFAIARRARAHGKHPFGAIQVGPDGTVLLEQENAFDTEGRAGHAETVLSRRACAASTAHELAATTMYASAEPCAMRAGPLYWAGIGRLVYAMSEHKLGSDHRPASGQPYAGPAVPRGVGARPAKGGRDRPTARG